MLEEEIRVVASQQQSAPDGGGNPLVLGQRYEVLPGSRLPELDSPRTEAFAVRDREGESQGFFALVCQRDALPRADLLEAFANCDRGPLLRPVEWQSLDWSPSGRRRFAIVFPLPGGGRLLPVEAEKFEPWGPDDVVRRVIRPLLPLFKELADRGLSHRAIRAENLFLDEAEGGTVLLGECVTVPPGLAQPVIYETIGGGMAEPSGRGAGTPADDLYALGVLLLVLLAGANPCAGMGDRDIIAAKLKRGSYSALVGKAQTPLAMMEPLRGLLCDDPRERWTVQDLELWLGGRHLTPKQPSLPDKAIRPFRFAGVEYWDARSLAHAMAIEWAEAGKTLRGGGLVEWVRRSLGDDERAEVISNTMKRATNSSEGGSGVEDRHVARVLMALDPEAPIRFRGLAVRIESLGQALAINGLQADWFERYDAVMKNRLPMAWFDAQPGNNPELVLLRKRLEDAVQIYAQDSPGLGVERYLYMLHPQTPCKSPILDAEYVQDVAELLPALERIAGRGTPSGEPVDRHVAGFCAAHFRHLPDRLTSDLAHDNPEQRILAMARLLAEIQRLTGPVRLPGLTGWLAGRIAPLVETYHYRPYRIQLRKEIEHLANRGVVGELCALLDNESVQRADRLGFQHAEAEFKAAAVEIAWLEEGGWTGPANILRSSRQAASIVSAMFAGLMLVIITVAHMLF